MRPVKILIRLRECAGWSESSPGTYVRRYISSRCGSNTCSYTQTLVLAIWLVTDEQIKSRHCQLNRERSIVVWNIIGYYPLRSSTMRNNSYNQLLLVRCYDGPFMQETSIVHGYYCKFIYPLWMNNSTDVWWNVRRLVNHYRNAEKKSVVAQIC